MRSGIGKCLVGMALLCGLAACERGPQPANSTESPREGRPPASPAATTASEDPPPPAAETSEPVATSKAAGPTATPAAERTAEAGAAPLVGPSTAETAPSITPAAPGRSVRPETETAREARLRRNREILGPIEAEILANWRNHSTVSLEFSTEAMPLKKSRIIEKDSQTGEGRRDSLILPDGREKIRMELGVMILIAQLPGDEPGDPSYYLLPTRRVQVSDGEFVYSYEQNKLGEAASKSRAIWPHVDYFGGPGLVGKLLVLEQLTRLDDELLDGVDCYVFRGVTQDFEKVHTYWIDKVTGLRRRQVIRNNPMGMMFTETVTKASIGVEFPEGHFELEIPEEVEIQDLTIPGAVFRSPGSDAADSGS